MSLWPAYKEREENVLLVNDGCVLKGFRACPKGGQSLHKKANFMAM